MDYRVREWVIRICFALIACTAVWTVFGDDLAQLFGSSQESAQRVESQRRN